jgi:hypothetical protein
VWRALPAAANKLQSCALIRCAMPASIGGALIGIVRVGGEAV